MFDSEPQAIGRANQLARKLGPFIDHTQVIELSEGDPCSLPEKDVEYLKSLDVKTLKSSIDSSLLVEAKDALLSALIKPNKAMSDGQINAYEKLNNGLKVHNETGHLYVYGMKVKKKVISEGEYKEDTRKPLTIAKDIIRATMKSTQYRQYRIDRAEKFTVSGDTLTFN